MKRGASAPLFLGGIMGNVLGGADPRGPLDRLRRKDLYVIADNNNLTYPVGAPAEDMRKLIEANNVDIRNSGIKWVPIQKQAENGSTYVDEYPEEKPHYSETKDINYDEKIEQMGKLTVEIEALNIELAGVINSKLDPSRKADKIERLRGQIEAAEQKKASLLGGPYKNELSEIDIDAEIARLQAIKTAKTINTADFESMRMSDLKKIAKERGLNVPRETKKPQLIEMLHG